jgi:hypothetical protein
LTYAGDVDLNEKLREWEKFYNFIVLIVKDKEG